MNLLAMARTAESEGRAPPAPLRAKAFRAKPLWLERAMRADSDGRLLPSAERPQSFAGVLHYGADPTRCYERITPRLAQQRSRDLGDRPTHRGPMKGQSYNRATFNLADLGESLLPGSRRMFDADIWNLLQDAPRPLYETHLAVKNLLLNFGLVRIHHAQVKLIGGKRLKKILGPPPPMNYADQLGSLVEKHTTFDIDLLSLLANLVHEAYLMKNRELHAMHLHALASHYSKLNLLEFNYDTCNGLGYEIQYKIIDQDWWRAGYRHRFPPIDPSQLLLTKSDFERFRKELPDLAGMRAWETIQLGTWYPRNSADT